MEFSAQKQRDEKATPFPTCSFQCKHNECVKVWPTCRPKLWLVRNNTQTQNQDFRSHTREYIWYFSNFFIKLYTLIPPQIPHRASGDSIFMSTLLLISNADTINHSEFKHLPGAPLHELSYQSHCILTQQTSAQSRRQLSLASCQLCFVKCQTENLQCFSWLCLYV